MKIQANKVFFLILIFLVGATIARLIEGSDSIPVAQAADRDSGASEIQAVTKADTKTLDALNKRYKDAASITMAVQKNLKLGLLAQEKKSSGRIWISKGRMRMELDGPEKTLLIVNKKNLFAVTYPSAEFKDAPVQVIKADMATKKGRSQNMLSVLTAGGVLKFFTAPSVQLVPNGEKIFFLQPKSDQVDFKRAQMRTSKDGKTITELKYWDVQDNETDLVFSDIQFGTKIPSTQFDFTPPEKAEYLTL
jgi:outer membrane lipoprotein-sorting protein